MRRAHQFFGRMLLATGALMLFFIITDFTGPQFPTWLLNCTFAAFGLALAGFAFTYKRWTPDSSPPGQPPDNPPKE